eukprot:315958-Pleurochrysis_carterae.AAC.1
MVHLLRYCPPQVAVANMRSTDIVEWEGWGRGVTVQSVPTPLSLYFYPVRSRPPAPARRNPPQE